MTRANKKAKQQEQQHAQEFLQWAEDRKKLAMQLFVARNHLGLDSDHVLVLANKCIEDAEFFLAALEQKSC